MLPNIHGSSTASIAAVGLAAGRLDRIVDKGDGTTVRNLRGRTPPMDCSPLHGDLMGQVDKPTDANEEANESRPCEDYGEHHAPGCELTIVLEHVGYIPAPAIFCPANESRCVMKFVKYLKRLAVIQFLAFCAPSIIDKVTCQICHAQEQCGHQQIKRTPLPAKW